MVDLLAMLLALVVMVVVWALISIPLYIAAKVVTDGRATLGAAMLGTLLGSMVFYGVYYLASRAASAFIGETLSLILGAALAFLTFLGLFKVLFHTTWGKALLTAILALAITVVVALVLTALAVGLGVLLLA